MRRAAGPLCISRRATSCPAGGVVEEGASARRLAVLASTLLPDDAIWHVHLPATLPVVIATELKQLYI